MERYGICTGCEQKRPIYRSAMARNEEKERGLENREINMMYGDSINFLVHTHDFYGSLCEGSNLVPQYVFPEN